VAVLDTGFDLEHPDFAGRVVHARSFVSGEAVQDAHGHGTHCIGIACGPLEPGAPPRYGIAHGADIYAGKVLNSQGSGGDREILTALGWAVEQRCQIASMSLGSPTEPGEPFSQVFEAAARRALSAGTAIVAAAGNESRRSAGHLAPVGHPANCPSVMAVGAIDELGRIADFSCTSDPRGGRVDIAAPGVDVHSSWPMPARYRTISGTSMATPAVAGVAALIAEADPAARAAELVRRLVQTAAPLAIPSADVGAGLVQAPARGEL
jgi:subtilisin family serine protease